MAELVVNASLREAVGKNKVNKIRNNNLVPGVIYAKDEENLNVQVDKGEFYQIFKQAGTSKIIDLNLNGERVSVLVKDYQLNHINDEFLHIDFQKVIAGEVMKVTVPVVLLGRDEIKVQPSVLIQNIEEVEVEVLPKDIPSAAEIDVTEMNIGDSFTVADLDIAKVSGIEILADKDDVVCSLQSPQEEEIDEETEETEEETQE
ncbi:MAG: 50S ribosomal protein L25 [Peptoniphilaceae bacterium]|nr:50S ribosomal protein L25 [Peptoniphilaceae bacterium]MDD7383316.1 50S ribosomal protein L25 [Peptoniphilaceae bacterium]